VDLAGKYGTRVLYTTRSSTVLVRLTVLRDRYSSIFNTGSTGTTAPCLLIPKVSGNLGTAQGEETPSYAHSFGMGKYSSTVPPRCGTSLSTRHTRVFLYWYTAATGIAYVPYLRNSAFSPGSLCRAVPIVAVLARSQTSLDYG